MIPCPSCGQTLPDGAKYCARCGRVVTAVPALGPRPGPPPPGVWALRPPAAPPAAGSLTAPPRAPIWLPLLFWVGALVPLFFGLVYTIAAVVPGLASEPGISPAELQETAAFLAGALFMLVVVQVVGGIGLLLGRMWGRIVATVVCAVWMVTLIGIPLSVIALATMWRRAEP